MCRGTKIRLYRKSYFNKIYVGVLKVDYIYSLFLVPQLTFELFLFLFFYYPPPPLKAMPLFFCTGPQKKPFLERWISN